MARYGVAPGGDIERPRDSSTIKRRVVAGDFGTLDLPPKADHRGAECHEQT